MTDDLISRKALFNAIETELWYDNADRNIAEDLLDKASAVDHVRHGQWIGYDTESWKSGKPIAKKFYRCTECRKASVVKTNYCPKCGAMMDGGKNNDQRQR